MGHESDTGDALRGVWRELDALVDEVQRAKAAVAAAQAHEAELLARAVDLVEARTCERRSKGVKFGNDLPLREVSAELGAAMRVDDRTVQRRIDDAHTLVTRFPATFAAWSEGRIDRQHATTIVDEGVILVDEEARREYEGLAVAVAEVETAGRMREIVRVIAARIDPEAAAARCKAALRGRDVRVVDLDDGMARLLADLPAPLAHAIMDRVSQFSHTVADAEKHERDARAAERAAAVAAVADDAGQAGQAGDAGEDAAAAAESDDLGRTLGEIRADVLADILLTSTPMGHFDAAGDAMTGIRGEVHVTIPVTTAAGVDEEPALLTGYGPVDADLVRQLMAAAPGWNRVVIDVPTGAPIGVDRYTPSAELRRFLNVRDERCRYPGCTMKPWRCDADHTVDAALGGPTFAENLANLCRRHHVLKHSSPWQVEQLDGGRLQWTSPTGRVYVDEVPSTLRFIPGPESVPVPIPGPVPDEPAPDGDPPPF
ncbi:DUF222 domain-containing protein [uncultured Microbacterium sp.]|uniref:HNH endonuclease signature motif containing protein n=1 Tax=uncultured Microbacterium sp. TaxID=191216 RepID=UPI0035CB1A9E